MVIFLPLSVTSAVPGGLGRLLLSSGGFCWVCSWACGCGCWATAASVNAMVKSAIRYRLRMFSLSPRLYESGVRLIAGGRAAPRRSLSMVYLSAINHMYHVNLQFWSFYT